MSTIAVGLNNRLRTKNWNNITGICPMKARNVVTLQHNTINLMKMKHIYSTILSLFFATSIMAQGWQNNYGGVMLQGFYWDSYVDSKWTTLEAQADELSSYFDLIWIPQSGNCNNSYNNMGYMPVYYFDQNSSFGTESELRKLISTFKSKNLGVIADVVINHRNNLGVGNSWVDFPKETYKGVDYQMLPSDICGNDDGGATKTWSNSKGYKLGNNDTGEDWSGCRDLDHTSANVQKCIKVYLDYLLNDLGYSGFRYDMTKGYSASYTAKYNKESGVSFSVGEYWDGNVNTLKSWVDGTKDNGTIMSAAFDFPFRYTVRDAINGNNWTKLANSSLMSQSGYSRYAVTFVENHDTQYRSATEQQDPIKKDTLAANAFLIAMPGTPCVFLSHWKDYKQEIKNMIDIRKAAGITNTSSYSNFASNTKYYANNVKGSKGNLIVVVGSNPDGYTASSTYVQVAKGYHYRYYLSKSTGTAWADKASGTYTDAFDVTLSAVSQSSDAKVVYTLDGSTPTANSTQVASGTKIRISSSETLKVGILSGSTVSGVITREYTVKPFKAHTATVYLKDPEWSPVYFYAWDPAELTAKWPGTSITDTKTIDGVKWYYHKFDVNTAGYSFNIIFNQGSGKLQTADLGPITEDTYFEITGTYGGKLVANDVTSTMTAIDGIKADNVQYGDNAYYTIGGQRVAAPAQKGIYIHNGKKIVVK